MAECLVCAGAGMSDRPCPECGYVTPTQGEVKALRMKLQREIPESEWRWRGMAGHLIVASRCCFHMVTDIGPHRVSTIGCYHPSDVGGPDQWNYDNRHTIGSDRLYETFVFKLDGQMDQIIPNEIDSEGYNDEWEAERGHIAMCRKWASLATQEGEDG